MCIYIHIMNIPNKDKKKRYQGMHPKLIHLDPDTFKILDTIARMKGWNLKQYIEHLCKEQAKYEAHEFIQKHEQSP